MSPKGRKIWKFIRNFILYPVMGLWLLWMLILGIALLTGDVKFKYTPQQEDHSKVDTDGPWIWYDDDFRHVGYYKNDSGAEIEATGLSADSLYPVYVPKPFKTFQVNVDGSHHSNELDVYPKVNKLVALSDLEGNFSAMTEALIKSSVIDSNYNWIFGEGHLVFLGDMVDRGLLVNQCLWLIYKLEKEAVRSGGKVHYILGNHEIMNMAGDLRYVRNKYIELAKELDVDYLEQVYGPQGEFGRWMRSKNVVEKIGNTLFVHGGISLDLFENGHKIQTINQISRKFYGKTKEEIKQSDEAKLIFGGDGPFWYRGYTEDDLSAAEVQNILDFYHVERIVFGHSIVDSIQTFYDNAIIGIDLLQPTDGGGVRWLLVENEKFYEENSKGHKRLVF